MSDDSNIYDFLYNFFLFLLSCPHNLNFCCIFDGFS